MPKRKTATQDELRDLAAAAIADRLLIVAMLSEHLSHAPDRDAARARLVGWARETARLLHGDFPQDMLEATSRTVEAVVDLALATTARPPLLH